MFLNKIIFILGATSFYHNIINVFFDPLSQFEVLVFSPFYYCPMTVNVTFFLLFVLLLLQFALYNGEASVLCVASFLLAGLHGLVKTIVKENLAVKTQIYFGNLFFLFLFLLLLNVIGLLPYSFTVTSSAIVTLFLSAGHFFGINLILIHRTRWTSGSTFLPGGSPLEIVFLLVPIEFVSYVARLFSLSIRLFANMLSGHALLKILIGFSWGILVSGTVYSVFFIVPWFIVTAVSFLELLISFLQAYVFTVLVTLYTNDVAHGH